MKEPHIVYARHDGRWRATYCAPHLDRLQSLEGWGVEKADAARELRLSALAFLQNAVADALGAIAYLEELTQ